MSMSITAPHVRRRGSRTTPWLLGRLPLLLVVLAALLALTPAPGVAASQGAPSVTGVAVTSDAGADSTYALGEIIRVMLTFSEAVEVTGSPRLKIDMDPAAWGEKWAAYESGSGTDMLTFAHTVVEPNYSSQGIAVVANSLEFNGGGIRSASSQNAAALAHTSLGHDADHKVDWQLSPAPPNRAPLVDTSARDYGRFTRSMNVPRGMLVSKSFHRVFSDPDGDDLTFSASVPEEHRELVDELALVLVDPRPSNLAHPDAFPRVFIRPDGAADWKTVSPALPDPLTLTVTLTATDSGGLSASVDSDFVVDWESGEPLTQLNLDDDPASSLGPQDSSPSGTPEQGDEEQATGPTVTGVEVTSDPGSDDTYELGDTIQISLTFSEAVDVIGSPQLKIDMDPADWGTKVVPYQSGSGTKTLTFAHVVVEPNYSTQGIAVLENTLELNSGTIMSTSSETAAALAHDGLTHQGEHRVNWQYVAQQPESPTVTEVAISSDADSDGSYAKGEVIRVTLRLSEAVNVTGTPRLKLDFRAGDGDERWASFESGSGTSTLVFAYTVAQGDDSDDGVAVLSNSLDLNGGTIVSASDAANNALLTHTGLVRDSNHRVDCTEPTLLSAVAEGTTVTLTFDEMLGAASSLSNDQFAVVRTPQGGTEESIGLTGAPVISSFSVMLTLASAVQDTDTDVKVSYTKPTTGANNRLIDIAGNEVESFSDVSAMSDTTPPRLVSGQIDGDTLIMYFSEALDETSIGGWFRLTITLYNGVRSSFTPNGGIEIQGNKVTVGLGQSAYGTRYVAKAGVTRNYAYYLKDDRPGAQVLRDLAGNPLETPRFFAGYHRTRIVTLENITVGSPRVTWVEFYSNPGEDATYGLGDTISVRVTFNQPVLVVGAPRIKIGFDSGVGARLGDERWAVYSGGSGTSQLEFDYTVAEAENSLNISTRGVAVFQNTLTGGTIRSVESSKNADRSHMGLGHHANHRVDIPLRLKSAELSGTTLTIHFNQPLGEARSLSNGAFVVKKRVAGGSVQTVGLSGSPLISGHTLTLKLSSAPSSTDYDVTVSYNKSGSGTGNKLVDTAGVELASFSDQSVGADVTPPTLVRGEVNGEMLTLVFNELLDEDYNEDHWFRVKLNHVEFYFQSDVQISGHRLTVRMGFGGLFYGAQPGLSGDNRAYYFKLNDPTGPGLRDMAGNEVSIPHQNHGFWSTRWVPLQNVTR